jgi:hypothetical protein
VKLGSLSGGDHRWFKRSTRNKKPVTTMIMIIIIIIIIIRNSVLCTPCRRA